MCFTARYILRDIYSQIASFYIKIFSGNLVLVMSNLQSLLVSLFIPTELEAITVILILNAFVVKITTVSNC